MDGEGVQAIIAAGRGSATLQDSKVIEGPGFKKLLLPVIGEEMKYEAIDLPCEELRPPTLKVHTLQGITEYIVSNREKLGLEQACFLHVVDHKTVRLVGIAGGTIPRRTVHVEATFDELTPAGDPPFKYGQFTDPETFNIAVQALFENAHDRERVLACAGNLRDAASSTISDDGITQGVELRHGLTLGKEAAVPNPVELAPFRTFREVTQPKSLFVFRARGGGDGKPPTLALFEADGGFWKLTAIENIKGYLATRVKDTKIAILA